MALLFHTQLLCPLHTSLLLLTSSQDSLWLCAWSDLIPSWPFSAHSLTCEQQKKLPFRWLTSWSQMPSILHFLTFLPCLGLPLGLLLYPQHLGYGLFNLASVWARFSWEISICSAYFMQRAGCKDSEGEEKRGRRDAPDIKMLVPSPLLAT